MCGGAYKAALAANQGDASSPPGFPNVDEKARGLFRMSAPIFAQEVGTCALT